MMTSQTYPITEFSTTYCVCPQLQCEYSSGDLWWNRNGKEASFLQSTAQ